MKIIFLDMDGVLCTKRAHTAQGIVGMPEHHPFMDALDHEGVGMLNKLQLKFPDIKYVLSSTWRKHHTKERMEDWLRKYGWAGDFHDDWKTPEFWGNTCRGDEIQHWLTEHQFGHGWTNYVILDDNSDMLDSQKFHFVQTDSFDGILMKHYWHMENIFDQGEVD